MARPGYDPGPGIYLVQFPVVRSMQEHNNLLFRTNSLETAQAWANMLQFHVTDTRSCYLNEVLPTDWETYRLW